VAQGLQPADVPSEECSRTTKWEQQQGRRRAETNSFRVGQLELRHHQGIIYHMLYTHKESTAQKRWLPVHRSGFSIGSADRSHHSYGYVEHKRTLVNRDNMRCTNLRHLQECLIRFVSLLLPLPFKPLGLIVTNLNGMNGRLSFPESNRTIANVLAVHFLPSL